MAHRSPAYEAIARRAQLFLSCWSNNSDSRYLSEAYQLLGLEMIEKAIFQWGWRRAQSHSIFIIPALEEIIDRSERGRSILDEAVDDQIMRRRFIAQGFEKAQVVKGKPTQIPPERWKLLTKNYSQSTAALSTEPVLFGITVKIVQGKAKLPKKQGSKGFTPPRDLALFVTVREWLEEQMRESPDVKRKTKQQLESEAIKKFGSAAGGRLFQDAFEVAVMNAHASAWSKPGPVLRIS